MEHKTMGMKEFGSLIAKLARREHLTKEEAERAFMSLLKNEQTEMQQGAFLSALTTKGETIIEMAACWNAIYHVDTIKPEALHDMIFTDNSGTGMDTYKTFNISTAASIIAAAAGVKMAKHGSRALTSMCGTIDLLEILGVDVESGVAPVINSIEKTGIGIFNGMSPKIHPQALGRILSQISFGTILNISASLANPALPRYAVRGVYSKDMLEPVACLMKEIGYRRAMIIYGEADGFAKSMDEASTIGRTYVVKLNDQGIISRYDFTPEDLGITRGNPDELRPLADREAEAIRFIRLMSGEDRSTREDIVCLNSALILELMELAGSVQEGYAMSKELIHNGRAFDKLTAWVKYQNLDASGVEKFYALKAKAC